LREGAEFMKLFSREGLKLFSREGLKLVGVEVGGTGATCIEGDCLRFKGVGFEGLNRLVVK
jgi:hypothetical protein